MSKMCSLNVDQSHVILLRDSHNDRVSKSLVIRAQASPVVNPIDIVREGRRAMHADGMLVKRTKNPEPQTPDILVTCNDPNLTPSECMF